MKSIYRPRLLPLTLPLALIASAVLGVLPVQAFYNASTGKWLSRDPIEEEGGLNLLAFAKNQPISAGDRLGQKTITLAVGFDRSADLTRRTKKVVTQGAEFLRAMLVKCRKLKDCECPELKDEPVSVRTIYDEQPKPTPMDDGVWDPSEDEPYGDSGLFRENLRKIIAQVDGSSAIPILLTRMPIYVFGIDPRTIRAYAQEELGMLYNIRLAADYVIAHEMGHVVGYSRPDNQVARQRCHAPDSEWGNLMGRFGGSKPDCQWCQKVASRAK